jgi:hypothetical protein
VKPANGGDKIFGKSRLFGARNSIPLASKRNFLRQPQFLSTNQMKNSRYKQGESKERDYIG